MFVSVPRFLATLLLLLAVSCAIVMRSVPDSHNSIPLFKSSTLDRSSSVDGSADALKKPLRQECFFLVHWRMAPAEWGGHVDATSERNLNYGRCGWTNMDRYTTVHVKRAPRSILLVKARENGKESWYVPIHCTGAHGSMFIDLPLQPVSATIMSTNNPKALALPGDGSTVSLPGSERQHRLFISRLLGRRPITASHQPPPQVSSEERNELPAEINSEAVHSPAVAKDLKEDEKLQVSVLISMPNPNARRSYGSDAGSDISVKGEHTTTSDVIKLTTGRKRERTGSQRW